MTLTNIRVGLLAYGAIGDEHNQAIMATLGFYENTFSASIAMTVS